MQSQKTARPPQSSRLPSTSGNNKASILYRAGGSNYASLLASPSPIPVYAHSCLSPAQVAKAHAAFLSYCETEPPTGSGQRSGGSGVVSAAASPSPTTSTVPSMGPKAVQRFLGDLGIVKTESEAKDVIFTLNQSAAIAHRNKKIDDRTGLSSGGGGSVMSGRTTGTEDTTYSSGAPTSSGGGKTAGQSLSFPLFLDLLTTTFPDHNSSSSSSKDDELRDAFQTIDVNGDGVLTATDITAILKTLLMDNPSNPDLRAIEHLTLEQLHAAIDEADLDGDGRVTLEDFVKILTTS